MNNYHHHVSGFFVHQRDAEKVISQIISNGIPTERVHLFNKNSAARSDTSKISDTTKDSSDEVLKDVLVDGAIGTAIGTGLGLLVEVALVAANVTLFIASPLIAPLALLGWGASIGGVVGASVGAAENPKPLSDLVHDAIVAGQSVVVVETLTKEETIMAGQAIQVSVGN